MSIADLISQIGGSLGLFVSFSIFTLFEFMEILILFIWGLFFEKKLNSVVQVSKNAQWQIEKSLRYGKLIVCKMWTIST